MVYDKKWQQVYENNIKEQGPDKMEKDKNDALALTKSIFNEALLATGTAQELQQAYEAGKPVEKGEKLQLIRLEKIAKKLKLDLYKII